MNLIEKTFVDAAWYWPPSVTGADGVTVYLSPQLLQWPAGGRWDDNPTTVVGSNGEVLQFNVRFTTAFPIAAGGWLLKAGTEGAKYPENGESPVQFPAAREIHTVSTLRDLRRRRVYYTGMIK